LSDVQKAVKRHQSDEVHMDSQRHEPPVKSRHALAYDKWHAGHEEFSRKAGTGNPLSFPWYRSAYDGLREYLNGDVLEIGCGRGEFAVWLAEAVPGVRMTGVDFSGAAIGFARDRAAAAGQPVRFLTCDAQSLPFPENHFDAVISCECMEHVPSPPAMAAEIYRVLKPGGKFCLTTENYLNGIMVSRVWSWLTGKAFDSGSGVQPIEHLFFFFTVRRYLRKGGLAVNRTASSHYQWLLLPRFDPARLCTEEFKSPWARFLAKPFGRHFSFFGHKP
jgi:ubiquinone/menaquinone biosynthesis C-methylase UbiE